MYDVLILIIDKLDTNTLTLVLFLVRSFHYNQHHINNKASHIHLYCFMYLERLRMKRWGCVPERCIGSGAVLWFRVNRNRGPVPGTRRVCTPVPVRSGLEFSSSGAVPVLIIQTLRFQSGSYKKNPVLVSYY